MVSKTEILKNLRREILMLGGLKQTAMAHPLQNPFPLLSTHLPGGVLPTAAIHEFLCTTPQQMAASAGFIASLIHTYLPPQAVIVWIQQGMPIFPNHLCQFNLHPENILFVTPSGTKELFWTIEECLQCPGVDAVVAETDALDFVYSRRFQLAVEQSKATGFIINKKNKSTNNACVSRWQITPAASVNMDLPGVGSPTWKVALQKIRSGKTGEWQIMWHQNKLRQVQANPSKVIQIYTEQTRIING